MKMSWLPCVTMYLAAAPLAAQTVDLPPWIRADPAGQVVHLELTATHPAGAASTLLNGERNGAIQIVVPRGWTVQWTWTNADSSAHSLVVMTEREKLPTEGGTAAFTNAMTRSLKGGLMPGRTDVSSFVAEDAGWFWMLCGVPGHAIAGEFIGLRVDPAATGVAVNRK